MAGVYFNALTQTPQTITASQTDAVLVRLRNASGAPIRISRIKKAMNNIAAADPKIIFKLWIADNGTGTTTTGMTVVGTAQGNSVPYNVSLYAGGTKGSNDVCYDIDQINSYTKDADFPAADGLWVPTSKELVITYTSGTLTNATTCAINFMGEA